MIAQAVDLLGHAQMTKRLVKTHIDLICSVPRARCAAELLRASKSKKGVLILPGFQQFIPKTKLHFGRISHGGVCVHGPPERCDAFAAEEEIAHRVNLR